MQFYSNVHLKPDMETGSTQTWQDENNYYNYFPKASYEEISCEPYQAFYMFMTRPRFTIYMVQKYKSIKKIH